MAVVNPEYDPMKKTDKRNREFYLFATNLKLGSIHEFIAIVPEEYRKIWNIETGYRVKNVFKNELVQNLLWCEHYISCFSAYCTMF
ncbi:MAG TPA: hypothetical protein C5S51_07930 [Methanosarcinaceae archaeon]|nr:hypothetical protein [Methanosarcinaceae archaeon]